MIFYCDLSAPDLSPPDACPSMKVFWRRLIAVVLGFQCILVNLVVFAGKLCGRLLGRHLGAYLGTLPAGGPSAWW